MGDAKKILNIFLELGFKSETWDRLRSTLSDILNVPAHKMELIDLSEYIFWDLQLLFANNMCEVLKIKEINFPEEEFCKFIQSNLDKFGGNK